MQTRADKIRDYLLKHLPKHPHNIIAVACGRFNVSRTAVHRHLTVLMNQGKVIKTGTTRDVAYYLSGELAKSFSCRISPTLSEFKVWDKYFNVPLDTLSNPAKDILLYGFTEMFNNAIDHSEGTRIDVSSQFNEKNIVISIQDNGVGIFQKLASNLLLDDLRESIVQLSMGKVTTDPKNHTGEGIFFTSRAVDCYELVANGLRYIRDNIENDWALEHLDENKTKGTRVTMMLSSSSLRDLSFIFKKYQDPETLAFNRTDILVKLSQFGGETFVSRSQAKRVLRNLDEFNYVTLDFTNVRMVGQGFVDQVFRVYAAQHPNITFDYINANPDIDFMIKRSLATQHN